MVFAKRIGEYQAEFKPIPHPKKEGSNRHSLKLTDKNNEVASLRWDFDENYVWVIEISVNKNYRRKKVATNITFKK